MEHQTSASIEILGSELRYAEVEREGELRRLVRLGSCGFDFDLERVIRGDSEGEWIQALTNAVRDILAGSAALDMHVALHEPLGSSLFVPIPVDTPQEERHEHLFRDVAIAFPGVETAFSAEMVRPEVLPDGENVEWWHVLAIPSKAAATLERIFRRVEVGRRRFCASMSGAAAVLRQVARDHQEETPVAAPYRIGVGLYKRQTEFVLMRNQAWQFGATYSAHTASDRLYHIRSYLEGLDVEIEDVTDVFVYGSEQDDELRELLSVLTGLSADPLDPLSVVNHYVDGLSDGFSIESYAACIGANLRDVYS